MQYLLMLYSNETAWPKMAKAEHEQGVAAYQAYTEALKNADVYKGSNRLQPVSSADCYCLFQPICAWVVAGISMRVKWSVLPSFCSQLKELSAADDGFILCRR